MCFLWSEWCRIKRLALARMLGMLFRSYARLNTGNKGSPCRDCTHWYPYCPLAQRECAARARHSKVISEYPYKVISDCPNSVDQANMLPLASGGILPASPSSPPEDAYNSQEPAPGIEGITQGVREWDSRIDDPNRKVSERGNDAQSTASEPDALLSDEDERKGKRVGMRPAL